MYGTASTATAGSAGTLAFTGDHIAAEIVLAVGLIFMGSAFVRASIRHRPHRP
jgi:hypothetical protein